MRVREESTIDETALFNWGFKNMAKFQVPSVIEIVPTLKETGGGHDLISGNSESEPPRFKRRWQCLPGESPP